MKRQSLFNELISNQYTIRIALFLIVCLFISLDIFAQGPDGDPGGDPDLIPVDGGLGFLLAAGVGYGVKKAREYRRKK